MKYCSQFIYVSLSAVTFLQSNTLLFADDLPQIIYRLLIIVLKKPNKQRTSKLELICYLIFFIEQNC